MNIAQEIATVDRIRKNIGDRQIIRMVPPAEKEVQTPDEQAIVDLLEVIDSMMIRLVSQGEELGRKNQECEELTVANGALHASRKSLQEEVESLSAEKREYYDLCVDAGIVFK